jgi:hypothetical protein
MAAALILYLPPSVSPSLYLDNFQRQKEAQIRCAHKKYLALLDMFMRAG